MGNRDSKKLTTESSVEGPKLPAVLLGDRRHVEERFFKKYDRKKYFALLDSIHETLLNNKKQGTNPFVRTDNMTLSKGEFMEAVIEHTDSPFLIYGIPLRQARYLSKKYGLRMTFTGICCDNCQDPGHQDDFPHILQFS